MNDEFKKVDNFLNTPQQELNFIFSKAKKLNALDRIFTTLLKEDLKKYCKVANMEGGTLVILAANASIATELRYDTNEILKKLHETKEFNQIKELKIMVRPQIEPLRNKNKENGIKPLSHESAKAVKEIALTIKDVRLREAMLRIASHEEDED